MGKEKYLNSIITKYKLLNNPQQTQALEEITLLIKSWAGETFKSLDLIGSHSKGTEISTSNDIDLLITLDSRTCFDLKNLYKNLFDFLSINGYSPFKKNISIGVIHRKLAFDLIPAIKTSDISKNIRVYNDRKNLCIETDILKHINIVKSSGLNRQIILTKIWRDINKLNFPSFYLELCVLDVLEHQKKDSLEENFLSVLNFFSEDFIRFPIIDPANSENIISDLLSSEDKKEIAQTAKKALKHASWEEIIW